MCSRPVSSLVCSEKNNAIETAYVNLGNQTEKHERSSIQLFDANTLHRALGLDRSLRRLGGWRSPEGADLLITVLATRDGYIFWVDLLAESGKLVRSDLVAASYHRAQTLDFRRHLGVGNDLAAGVFDKAEIAWPVIMIL